MSKIYNTQWFKERVRELTGTEYDVMGEYQKSYVKIKIRHTLCDYEYEVRPNSFLRGARCPNCAKKTTITDTLFKQRVEECVGKDYEVLGEYIKSNIKILVRHRVCGHKYEVTPNNLLSGSRCPNCRPIYRKTNERFKEEVFNLVGNEYEVLSDYQAGHLKLSMKHRECGYQYEVRPNLFLQGARCPKCSKSPRKNTEQFREEVFKLVGDEYTVLGDYQKSYIKVRFKHMCGHEYEVTPNNFLNGSRCPNCRVNRRKNTEIFKEEVFKLVGDEYSVVGEYQRSSAEIEIKHHACGYHYQVVSSRFLAGTRCPNCSKKKNKTTRQFKEEVFAKVKDEYIVLGEYVNSHHKIQMRHNLCDYTYFVTPNNFLNGTRCPKCSRRLRKTKK